MAKSTKFTATFAWNGGLLEVKRSSAHAYTAAWAVLNPEGKIVATGFARTPELAASAARAWKGRCTGRMDFNAMTKGPGLKFATYAAYARRTIAEKGGKAAWEAEIVKAEAAWNFMTVPVRAA